LGTRDDAGVVGGNEKRRKVRMKLFDWLGRSSHDDHDHDHRRHDHDHRDHDRHDDRDHRGHRY
jgi:ABC-type Zn2+ transport system substrate-binding protein/surface adhesin